MGRPGPIADIQPVAVLQEGATVVVYKGYQRALDRSVLLKVLKPASSAEPARARRFEEEARLIARVQHPNVVAVYACGREEAGAYLVAEYVEGRDLATVLEAGPLPPVLAAYVLREAARGLQAAHEKGVLHRDVKPANLLVSFEGHVKVADFGMASLSGDDAEAAEVRGTPGYLAPEQVLGAAPGPAADLFGLGATFFEMLTGRRAFAGAGTQALLDAVLHHDPLPHLAADPAVPKPLVEVARRLLEKAPERRPADAAALVADLDAFLARHGTPGAAGLRRYLEDPAAYREPQAPAAPAAAKAPEAAPKAPAPESGRRSRRATLSLAGLLVLLAGLGYVIVSARKDAVPPDDRLRTETPSVRDTAMHDRSTADSSRSAATDTTAAILPADARRGDPPVAHPAEPDPIAAERIDPSSPPETDARDDAARTPEPVAGEGRLQVDAQPWAAVYVEADSLGTTPFEAPLAAGTYVVELRNPEFPAYRATVDVAPGETARLAPSLWTLVGTLSLEVSPWAVVYVDGVARDTVPPQKRPLVLSPGTHVLSLRHTALGRRDTTLSVAAGERLSLRFNLNHDLTP